MKLSKNEKAVSPVIGVILMVVITVIIAAILAVFALGMGGPSKAPAASIKVISTDITGDSVRLQHSGGDSLSLNNVKLIVEQTKVDGTISRYSVDSVDLGTGGAPPAKLKTGDTLEVNLNTGVITSNLDTANSLTPSTAVGAITLVAGSEVVITLVDVPTGSEISSSKISI